MLILVQNESSATLRRVPFYMVNDIDGKTPVTGLTFSGSEIQVSKNGNAEANFTGSVIEVGNGLYTYVLAAGEVDTLGYITIRFEKATVRVFIATHQVGAVNIYDQTAGVLDAPNTIDGFSLRNIFRYVAAILFGRVTGAPGSPVFKSADGTTTRVSAVADSSGNRSSVNLS